VSVTDTQPPCPCCGSPSEFVKEEADGLDWWRLRCTDDECGVETGLWGMKYMAAKVWKCRVATMTCRDFLNALNSMHFVDRDQAIKAGVLPPTGAGWNDLTIDPYRWMIRASDDQAEKLFALIQRRQG
jgi:hypothetical protein